MRNIKHFFDIVVYLIHRGYWNLMSRFGHVHGVVLMYHYITDKKVDTLASCQHSPSVFKATLKRLKNEDYSLISVDRMMEIIKNKERIKFAVVTFDDCMDDVYDNAYPFLKQYNIPFTLFVAPSLIDTDAFITRRHLEIMAADPLCTVGAHSMSHCSLRKVANSKEEMVESKKQLESIIGKGVKYMAYPYGWHCDVSRRNMKEAEEAGYECAFGTIQSPVSAVSSKSRFYLPRKVLMR